MKTPLVALVILAVAGNIIYFLNLGETIQADSSDGEQAAVTETKTGSTTTVITSKDMLEFISRSSKTSNEYPPVRLCHVAPSFHISLDISQTALRR